MFLCLLPAGAVRSQICEDEFGYIFRRHVILQVLKLFTIREQNTKVWTVIYPHAKFEKAAPVTIEMFDKSKLTTSTKVSSLYLVTTGGVLSFCHIEGQKSGLQQFL